MNDYHFQYKGQRYLIRTQPDIAVRGGSRGKGTRTHINRLDESGNVIVPGFGFQGRQSKAAIIRAIKEAQ